MTFSRLLVLSVRFGAVGTSVFSLFFLGHVFVTLFLLERLYLVEESFLVPFTTLVFAAPLLIFTFFFLSCKLFESLSLLKFEIKCSAKFLFLGNVEGPFELSHLLLFHHGSLVSISQIRLNLHDQAFPESQPFLSHPLHDLLFCKARLIQPQLLGKPIHFRLYLTFFLMLQQLSVRSFWQR